MLDWFGKIFGGSGVGETVEKVGGVFGANKEKSAQRGHDLDMAVLNQFAAEFNARNNRTWWDSFVDGLNRLPRPLFALWVIFIFVLPTFKPEVFTAMMSGYQLVPEGMWILIGTVITFYFGGRMQLKSQDFRLKGDAVQMARQVSELQREQYGWASRPENIPTKTDPKFESAVSVSQETKNTAIIQWLAQQQAKANAEKAEAENN